MTDALVKLEDATVAFEGTAVVDRVNLTVSRGDIITIIGPNGAGKTTLIKAIIGVQPLSDGKLWRQRGLTIGYVPQSLHLQLTLPMSVKRFMATTGEPAAVCRDALAETGVEHLQEAAVHRLSGGEMQRLLIARALARKPDLLVLDEPAQGVDINGQASLYELIRRLRDRLNCGVIMISHDLHLVMAATDRVICLNQHVCCSGYPEDISRDPGFVEVFGRSVADSLAVYHHHHNHSHGLSGEVIAPDQARSQHEHEHCQHDHH
ncbi:MAG: metal ABC transporter ATP-binding protein [Marinobacter sp.]|uniref:metal ABC transporter ATP-binding protein n=1 Tax=Marinobacter sp. TaxID=50741 RepID=UPI00299EF0AE|nr:metal ABC transporter ATP-binding protein [Marinobacter sp.]MDX1635493.1 metal ABC transporter ATP-binding protein [Marinobacter sp.]